MLMILGLLAVLLVPLPSLTEGKKVNYFCLLRSEEPQETRKKVSNVAQVNLFPIATKSDFKP